MCIKNIVKHSVADVNLLLKDIKIKRIKRKKIIIKMIIDTNTDYIHRVNGIPLFYNPSGSNSSGSFNSLPLYSLYATPSPPCDFIMTSENTQESLSPPLIITLTPPLSPSSSTVCGSNNNDQSQRRGSVIMKVENCQITPCANDTQQISIDHVCRWENCYR